MPDNIAPPSTSAMGFGKEVAGVKPSTKTSQTTVELMAGLGLKFVHATSKGGRGMDGDLEKSRNQVLN